MLALETHAGAIAVHSAAARELLARCPGLMLTYDPSHYIAEQIPVSETLDLLEHAAHVHLRNARVGHCQEQIDAATGKGYDAIVLVYGLCNNGIVGLVARDTRVVMARAHDCITLLMGDRQRYLEGRFPNPW